jgi:hypothetical protein
MELILKAYYAMIDDCAHSPSWVRKIEEDLGQSMALMAITFDESARDALVLQSEVFQRFVSLYLTRTSLGLGEAEVLQMKK